LRIFNRIGVVPSQLQLTVEPSVGSRFVITLLLFYMKYLGERRHESLHFSFLIPHGFPHRLAVPVMVSRELEEAGILSTAVDKTINEGVTAWLMVEALSELCSHS